MRDVNVSVPEMIFVALTRGMAGAGIGLLVADYVEPVARKPIGWTLFAIGALTTLPIAATLMGRARRPLLAD
jgi:sorbitol-specific phosphotransferase system component IIBC